MSADAPASVPDPVPMQGAEDAKDDRPSGPAEIVSGPGAVEAVSGENVPFAAAEPPFAPIAPPATANAPRRRRPPKWLLPTVGGVLAAALVAGLLVWQPWSPRPIAPVSLTAESPTGTSVQLSWPAPNGGATPDHYVILRDGAQVAEVPGDETSWTNAGLRPGDKFRYEVATRGRWLAIRAVAGREGDHDRPEPGRAEGRVDLLQRDADLEAVTARPGARQIRGLQRVRTDGNA